MMRASKLRAGRATVMTGFMVAAVFTIAGTAWAICSPYHPGVGSNASALNVSPTHAPAGSAVMVTGSNWYSAVHATSVTIHWGSATGPVLGQLDPVPVTQWSIPVTIPQDSGGQLVAVFVPDYTYTLGFTVTPSSASSGLAQPAPTGSSTQQVSGGSSSPTPAQPDQRVTPAPAAQTPAPAAQTPAPVGQSADQPQPTAAQAGQSNAVLVFPTQTAPSSPAPNQAAVSQPGTVRAPSVTPRGSSSSGVGPLATPGSTTGAVAPAASAVPDRSAAGSQGSVAASLWSGFRGGASTPAVGLLTVPGAAGGGSSSTAVGVGMLSGGLVALFAGFAVAEARRRRAPTAAGR